MTYFYYSIYVDTNFKLIFKTLSMTQRNKEGSILSQCKHIIMIRAHKKMFYTVYWSFAYLSGILFTQIFSKFSL